MADDREATYADYRLWYTIVVPPSPHGYVCSVLFGLYVFYACSEDAYLVDPGGPIMERTPTFGTGRTPLATSSTQTSSRTLGRRESERQTFQQRVMPLLFVRILGLRDIRAAAFAESVFLHAPAPRDIGAADRPAEIHVPSYASGSFVMFTCSTYGIFERQTFQP